MQKASRQLALLSAPEREGVLKYIHVRDAKMALASRLLKRYIITRFAGEPSGTPISWWDAVATPNKDTKPVFVLPDGTEPLLFNVSHQAGLVVLVGTLNAPAGVTVGVDIVCPTERRARDHDMVRRDGWRGFVDMHADVFSSADVRALERLPPSGGGAAVNTPPVLDRKLRYFYTLWCLREAYVKMTGEALLAPWLKDLEMRRFAPPEDVDVEAPLEIYMRGRRVENVDMELVNILDKEYTIGTSVGRNAAGEGLTLGAYEFLDIEEVTAFGEAAVVADGA